MLSATSIASIALSTHVAFCLVYAIGALTTVPGIPFLSTSSPCAFSEHLAGNALCSRFRALLPVEATLYLDLFHAVIGSANLAVVAGLVAGLATGALPAACVLALSNDAVLLFVMRCIRSTTARIDAEGKFGGLLDGVRDAEHLLMGLGALTAFALVMLVAAGKRKKKD